MKPTEAATTGQQIVAYIRSLRSDAGLTPGETQDVADLLEKLEAENARLREALERIASEAAASWIADMARKALAAADEGEKEPVCICPRFRDVPEGTIIADLTCPVHGVNGTDPGDVLPAADEEQK